MDSPGASQGFLGFPGPFGEAFLGFLGVPWGLLDSSGASQGFLGFPGAFGEASLGFLEFPWDLLDSPGLGLSGLFRRLLDSLPGPFGFALLFPRALGVSNGY